MNKSRNGFGVVAGIITLVVIAALVLGGLYFFSDVFRTKMQSGWKSFSEWTPENIAKDPVGYLDFCETQTKAAQQKLKASEIAIAQSKGKFTAARDEAKKLMDGGVKALDDLKPLYRKADEANDWPLKWSDRTFDKEQARKQIVRLDREMKAKAEVVKGYEAGIKQLEVQASKVQDAKDQASDQLTKIATNREQLKVKSITDDLKNQLVDMKAVLQTSVIGVADEKSTVSLEDIAAKSESKVSDEDFNKIMGGK